MSVPLPPSIFVKPTHEYERDLDLVGAAKKNYAHYLHLNTGKPLEECAAFVDRKFGEDKKYNYAQGDLKCVVRQENQDRKLQKVNFITLLDTVQKHGYTLTPNLCVYDNPKVNRSFTGQYILTNLARRAAVKKISVIAQATGDTATFDYNTNVEANIKRGLNAISGTRLSPHTPLYHKTAHSALTSICRVIACYSNGSTERMIAGNRHYRNYKIARDNIISVTSDFDREGMKSIVEKYNLHIPTAAETADVVMRSLTFYYRSLSDEQALVNLCHRLDDMQRCAFVYIGDFYHLRVFNDAFVRDLCRRLITPPDFIVDDPEAVIKGASEDMIALMGLQCAQFLKGIDPGKMKNEVTPEQYNLYAATIVNIDEIFEEHIDLIRVLWTTRHAPPSIHAFPHCIRRSVAGGDTDSTMFTIQEWVKWYFGQIYFHEDAFRISSMICYVSIQVAKHFFAMTSRHMGVEDEYLYYLTMKNEYTFAIYLVANRAKHYGTVLTSREGMMYKKPKLEMKGVSLKDSKVAPEIMKGLHDYFYQLMMDILNDKGVSVFDVFEHISNIEHEIYHSLDNREVKYLSTFGLKAVGAYKNERNHNYMQYNLWETVFADRYGEAGAPPYGCYKLSTLLEKPKAFRTWLETAPPDMAMKLKDWTVANKSVEGHKQFLIPIHRNPTHFPVELAEALDKRKIVVELMAGYYILLEMLGMYYRNKTNTRLVSDEVPPTKEGLTWVTQPKS